MLSELGKREIIPGKLLMFDCFYQGEKCHLINVYTAPEAPQKISII